MLESFVVRVVAGRAGDPLAGVVEHVRTGCSRPFADEEELLAALRDPIRAVARDDRGGDQKEQP